MWRNPKNFTHKLKIPPKGKEPDADCQNLGQNLTNSFSSKHSLTFVRIWVRILQTIFSSKHHLTFQRKSISTGYSQRKGTWVKLRKYLWTGDWIFEFKVVCDDFGTLLSFWWLIPRFSINCLRCRQSHSYSNIWIILKISVLCLNPTWFVSDKIWKRIALEKFF